ncbi:MAG: M56 family metallopeptidase [Clostridiaceae bacterium]
MMEQVFRTLLNMSYTGSIVILAVRALRALLKAAKAPAWISYALWSAALFRLLCPFSLESALALLPSTSPIPQGFTTAQQPAIHTGFEVFNTYVNPALSESLAPASPTASANPAQVLFFIGGLVWLMGAAAVLLSGAISAVRLRRNLRFAVRAQDGVYESENLSSAFVWGVLRPRIYMPAGLNALGRAHILLHEKTHIRRRDHIAKLLFFLAAAAHWFNPFAWLAFRLFEKDMELSCDESVLARAGEDIRKPYSETLLAVSARRARGFLPISFGESSVKSRIRHALSYKKPALWVVIGAVVLAAALGATLVLNPLGAGRLTAKGRPPEADISSLLLDKAQQYSYTVDRSIKSVVFYAAVYDRFAHPIELDSAQLTSSSAVFSPLSVQNAAAVAVEGSKGAFAALIAVSGGVNIYVSPEVFTSATKSRFLMGTSLTPPASYAADSSSILLNASLPIEAEKPIPLYVRAFSQDADAAPVSCEALMDGASPLYTYDYAYVLYCMFSTRPAAELTAEYEAIIQGAEPTAENGANAQGAEPPSGPADTAAPLAEQRIDFIEDDKVVSSVPLEGDESALEVLRNAIFGQMILSSAWPAEDMANYPDRFDIYARLSTLYPEGGSASEDNELTVYHVFEKDGRPCFQMGTGMWTFMLDETYAAILSLKGGAQ